MDTALASLLLIPRGDVSAVQWAILLTLNVKSTRSELRRWETVRTLYVAARNAGLTDVANSERITSYPNNK